MKKMFRFSSAAENVAFCTDQDMKPLAKTIVDGWINSPGHRKNLEGKFTHCTIGVMKNIQNRWYFT
jgi:uncharacterized protein YkwD